MTPDSLLRRVVIGVLRSPTPRGIQAVRQLFQTLGGHAIVGVWDAAATDLTAYHGAGGGGTWYHALGHGRVAELRRLLSDDLNSNLFVSEAQGNLVANELLLGYDGAAGEFWRYGCRATELTTCM